MQSVIITAKVNPLKKAIIGIITKTAKLSFGKIEF
jgi:hypothetical protein